MRLREHEPIALRAAPGSDHATSGGTCGACSHGMNRVRSTPLATIDLADVRGGYGTSRPTNFFTFKNPPLLNDVVGSNITPEQRRSNDLLKQKLKDERWIRHKDTPEWERHDGTGFAFPVF
jgi:hypothetical protein